MPCSTSIYPLIVNKDSPPAGDNVLGVQRLDECMTLDKFSVCLAQNTTLGARNLQTDEQSMLFGIHSLEIGYRTALAPLQKRRGESNPGQNGSRSRALT